MAVSGGPVIDLDGPGPGIALRLLPGHGSSIAPRTVRRNGCHELPTNADPRSDRRRHDLAGAPDRPNASSGAPDSHWTPARRLAFLIAVGIGLHNLCEGLAIGTSAASGEIKLATMLIIGFALHNATEGFGIVAPFAAAGERASWRFLIGLGLIGGFPTFLGTVVGHSTTSNTLEIAFLTLAAGSIIYVIIQLLAVAQKGGRKDLLTWGIFAGLIAGFLTDMIVTAAGA